MELDMLDISSFTIDNSWLMMTPLIRNCNE